MDKKRIVGIDFGLKRTGLAITDENNIIASGLTTVPTKELMNYLIQLVKDKNVGVFVLGEPKRLNMQDSHSSENVRLFKTALENQFPNYNVVMMDERFTSKMAKQTIIDSGIKKNKRKDKGLVDEVSATIILQSYMDQQTFL